LEEYETLGNEQWEALVLLMEEESNTSSRSEEDLVNHHSGILQKDIIIIRLYLTFLDQGWAYSKTDKEFLS
jgi:hypothetical protein